MQNSTCILILAFLGTLFAPSLDASELAAFTSQQLKLQLRQQISATWQGQQLGVVLQQLEDTQGIAIWLDRRVDPQQEVDLRLADATLQQVLEELTRKQKLGVSVLENIVYVGPEAAARELNTLSRRAHDSLKKIPPKARARWLRKGPSGWQPLSNPKELVAEILQVVQSKSTGLEIIPHDLWAAKQLPPLPLIDQLVLLLTGFDLTCNLATESDLCEIISIERPVVVSRQYTLPRNDKGLLQKLKRELPNGNFEQKGNSFLFSGRWEEHRQVLKQLDKRPNSTRNSPRRPPSSTEKKFTLQLQNQPVGVVINQLANQLKLTITWDQTSLSAAGISQDAIVSCQAKNVDLDELLQNILSPAGLLSKRIGNHVTIKASNPGD